MNENTPRPTTGIYVGLALVTLATLAYQLLLTRIFSVTVSYHYSFMAVSLAMFGMTAGAVLVYLRPGWFPVAATPARMALAGSATAALMVLTYWGHLQMGLTPFADLDEPATRLASVLLNYVSLALPFAVNGVCVTVALSRFPAFVGRLYAADLFGAGTGCLLVAILSHWIDSPTLILFASAAAALGGLCCLEQTEQRMWLWLSASVLLAMGLVIAYNMTPQGRAARVFYPRWVKGEIESQPLYERWNAYSRVAVWPASNEPLGWGMSPRFRPKSPTNQLWLNIDASAGTAMTEFDGDASRLDHLRYDVTSLVHYLRGNARVLVVGSGGGRDVLTALHFQQPTIVAVEINDAVLDTVNRQFGDFTGHLDRQPGVTFVHDEARSYLARTQETFDIIQISLIDTWAATVAGAYALTENALYTTQAWQSMLEKLSDRGILSVSRWYSPREPDQFYRATALASAALRQSGVAQPSRHLLAVWRRDATPPGLGSGLATLLVGRRPFTAEDLDAIKRLAAEMDFEVLLSPRGAGDPMLKQLATVEDLDGFARLYPTDISPPTDDRPFFFDTVRLRAVLIHAGLIDGDAGELTAAVETLAMLLLTSFVLTGLVVVVPFVLTVRRQSVQSVLPCLVYFGCIGLGFMLVEIGLMQRLSIFLGHPIYSMTVVLFCLLLASGGGSWLSSVLVKDAQVAWRGPACLGVLVGVVVVNAAILRHLSHVEGTATATRIAIAVAILTPTGMALGMGFPLGMRLAARRSGDLAPWLFGVNGAASICGAILAMIISLSFGISAALLTGGGCYLVALVAFLWMRQ